MHSEDGTVHAVVNGMLYDYEELRGCLEGRGCVFKTRCDSELVVHLYRVYGQNMLFHLRGEFAFVLYDSRRRRLFAARDRFGIKPLYYTLDNNKGRLLLASEMKAFLAYGWKAEWDVESIVQMGEFTDMRTVFKGVHKLPPGHQLTFSTSGHLTIQQYWDRTFPTSTSTAPEPRTVPSMIQGVHDRLLSAIRARLRSDVPLAVCLSGGIDSAAVAGIAAALLRETPTCTSKDKDEDPNVNADANAKPTTRIATFTLSFPDRPEHDETPIALRMAHHINAHPYIVPLTESALVSNFEETVWHTEQPNFTFHPSAKALLAQAIREEGYKVVLSGEGSDEIFGGYAFEGVDYLRAVDPSAVGLGFELPSARDLERALRGREEEGLEQDHVSMRPLRHDDEKAGREMLGGIFGHRFVASMCPGGELFSQEAREEFSFLGLEGRGCEHTEVIAEGLRPEVRWNAVGGRWHPLNVSMYAVSKTVFHNFVISSEGDRAEMAHSIEGRPPFLDHTLVEYVDSLPPSVKVRPHLNLNLPEGPIGPYDSDQPPNSNSNSNSKWSFTEKWILREAVRPYVTEEIYMRPKVQFNAPVKGVESQMPVGSGSAAESRAGEANSVREAVESAPSSLVSVSSDEGYASLLNTSFSTPFSAPTPSLSTPTTSTSTTTPAHTSRSNHTQTPLQTLLSNLLTPQSIRALRFLDEGYVLGVLEEFTGGESWSHGQAKDDGGLDARARILLWCVSFVVLGRRFGVPAWEGGRAHGYE
ncbi:uncharacterized protein STEHIDRAFT_170025 [Stereum hirsutum FP-91666 SS1]|uniref:uncharacterized protein n=1 Tax=Stereum hirsutum (strain FP-91666) TaxID=721885 RepID=UPI0004449D1A|nr:uncharacterized protein STEHIDRAFT_170025 [Stereum hirsutum FP-91666 SS1]EIM84292.1 hypothetical protein STEHIDRAFT_170025 [Stereum hirsutum FP-91666 SS1]